MAISIDQSNISKYGVPDLVFSFFKKSIPNLLLVLKSAQLFKPHSTLAQLCNTLHLNKDITFDIQCENRVQSSQGKEYFNICNDLLIHSKNINTDDNKENLSLLFEKYQEVVINPMYNDTGAETVASNHIEYLWSLANPGSLKSFIQLVGINDYCRRSSHTTIPMGDDSKKQLSRFLKVMKEFQEGVFKSKN